MEWRIGDEVISASGLAAAYQFTNPGKRVISMTCPVGEQSYVATSGVCVSEPSAAYLDILEHIRSELKWDLPERVQKVLSVAAKASMGRKSVGKF